MTALHPSEADAAIRLGEALAGAMSQAIGATTGAATVVAATVAVPAVDPISLFAAAAEAGLEAALWLRPSEGTALVGIGRAWAIEGEGRNRFQEAEAAFRELMAGARLERPAARGPARGRGSAATTLPGQRKLRWARPEEQAEAITTSALFVTVGLVLVVIGLAIDSRFQIV